VLVDVLVAEDRIEGRYPAEELADLVRIESVPQKVAATGVVADLTPLAGLVAAIDLLPGEQLVTSRFVTPEEYEESLAAGWRSRFPPISFR